MQLMTKPKKSSLLLDADWERLVFHCSPTPVSRVLEIGDRHIFANWAIRPIFAMRRSCNLQVWVKRKSALTPESIEKLALSNSKIGALAFVPPDRDLLLWRWRRAALDADVFVSDELFERLVSALQAGRKANWLDIEIGKNEELEYGREPDRSRSFWKLESPTEVSYVDIEGIDIDIAYSRSFFDRLRMPIAYLIASPIRSVIIGALAFIALKWIVFLLTRK